MRRVVTVLLLTVVAVVLVGCGATAAETAPTPISSYNQNPTSAK